MPPTPTPQANRFRFRAWHKTERVMTKFDLPGLLEDADSGNHQGYDSHFDHYDWMQSTGLFDRNGKEIFEGDVVEEVTESRTFTYRIVWDDHECSFEFKPLNFKSAISHNMGSIYTDVAVIGNIYENPELLPAA